jgi:hypothetical protein
MYLLAQIKQPLKKLRWRLRRAQVAGRWGSDDLSRSPIVVGNAMPKSGSHLLIQVLLGLTRIGPFVDPGMPPITRSSTNQNLGQSEILESLHHLLPGDIVYCYLHAQKQYIAELTRPGVAAYFIYRDPRDLIISHIFYATEMHPKHGMHKYYTQKLSSMEQRINAAIQGVHESDAQLSSITAKYKNYLGWLDQSSVLSVRFEDLVLDRTTSLNRIMDHLAARGFEPKLPHNQVIDILASSIVPRSSGTFRRGQPGEWRDHFTAENKRIFRSATDDLLHRLGYEKDNLW